MNHSIALRPAVPADFGAICQINLLDEQHTSAMDEARLTLLHALSSYHYVACVNDQLAAFVLAMRDSAAYLNPNFDWFAQRYKPFIYIDRIVVSPSFRGLGLGSKLYNELFRYAKLHQISTICCEYNIVPPNESSRLFHDKFGFQEQGRQWLANGSKQVSLQVATI